MVYKKKRIDSLQMSSIFLFVESNLLCPMCEMLFLRKLFVRYKLYVEDRVYQQGSGSVILMLPLLPAVSCAPIASYRACGGWMLAWLLGRLSPSLVHSSSP